ncbi:MAG: hypothetical protein CMD41_05365 [Gammaproteobacteria bacterium]|nr:hypothetical protein [Gammaproteobacteria bacterium]MCH2577387.1 DUF4389 domain-containing protein [Pseudomonadales bacterium]MEC7767457.1 DUF4389 domain-containing protein [Pseudomonadota bacterium]MEE3143082.1 DUF4389 domain-containing protein [Pseudomonadota bacterium]HBX99374.1 hypothetical protein [Gammaproteobacteria bacterium]|tara:strand:+ start:7050 stop:7481 length:432 start_codon:yes stop_codon:yes gene_type:complete
MAEKLDNIIGNLKQGSAWVRVILMIAFAVVLYVIIPAIVLVLMLTQTLFVFITGDSNDNLRVLGTALSKYIFEVLQFLSYASDNRPFPFSAFPSVENDDFSFNTEEKSDEKIRDVKKKGPAKKVVKKKSTSRKSAVKKSGPVK